VTEINKVAKTGYGRAYVYFKNKNELFIALIERVMKKMYDVAGLPFVPKTKQAAYDQIKHQVELFIQSAIEEKKVMKIIKEAIGISEIVREKWRKIKVHFIEEITEDIRFVQKTRLVRADINPTLIAKSWFYLNEQ